MQRWFYPHLWALFFWFTIFGWQVIEHRSGFKHKPAQRTKAGLRNDIVTLLVPTLSMFLAFILKFVLPDSQMYTTPVLFWLGLVITWCGILLRQVAIKTLGKFFVTTIITQPNQPVITSGVYRYIRHPSYLGGLITIIGVSLALNSLLGAVLMIGATSFVILQRITFEESYLLLQMGRPYREYTKHTKKLLPFVW